MYTYGVYIFREAGVNYQVEAKSKTLYMALEALRKFQLVFHVFLSAVVSRYLEFQGLGFLHDAVELADEVLLPLNGSS